MQTHMIASALAATLVFGGVSGFSAITFAQVNSQVSNPTVIASTSSTSKSWKAPEVIRSFPDQARQLAFSCDHKILAGVIDRVDVNLIKLWNVDTGVEIATLTGHPQSIDAIAFSPNGQIFASSSYDNYGEVLTIKLWDSRTGRELRTLSSTVAPYKYVDSNNIEQRGGGSAIAFSPDSQTLATVAGGSTTIQLWDVATGKVRSTFNGGQGNKLVFSPNGEKLARLTNRSIHLWNPKTGKSLRMLQSQSPLIDARFSPDSQALITWAGMEPEPEHKIQIWNLKTGKRTRSVGGFHWDAQIALSPDAGTFAVGSPSTSLQLFDMQTGAAIANLKDYLTGSSAIAFSPDGQLFAASLGYSGNDNNIKVWR